jgi:hypothetical protein
MSPKTNLKKKKELEAKMASVFQDQIKSLPAEHQEILIDDLVTAFENRFAVLSRSQTGLQFSVEDQKSVELEVS